MSNVQANGIQIEFDTFGDAANPALLLVMGLGAQMVSWQEEFCDGLAERDFFVIRYDNRDVGLSTKLDSAGIPDVAKARADAEAGLPVSAPYTLSDMAADGMGLLDALGIDRAHVVGASMGGMIVQTMAIDHPQRLISLTSIMSTTGEPGLPPSSPEAQAQLMTPAPTDRASYIENAVKGSHIYGCAAHRRNDEKRREMAAAAYDRCFYPQGFARQIVGIAASGPRHQKLASVSTPTLVIHGAMDSLINIEGGRATARAIKGSELLILDEMGHDLPESYWPEIFGAISALAARAS